MVMVMVMVVVIVIVLVLVIVVVAVVVVVVVVSPTKRPLNRTLTEGELTHMVPWRKIVPSTLYSLHLLFSL